MAETVGVLDRGHVAVITGGASGIGLAVAEQLIERGMRVVLADIDEPKLRDVEARLTEAGADVTGVICDTADESSVTDLAEAVLSKYGAAHLLFNNAGIAGVGDAWTGDMSLWHRVVGINLYGVVHGIRSFLPIMTEQGIGHIVNTASIAGLIAVPGLGPYNATKHGVVAISEGLFIELGVTESPVGVSVLCPGFVKTDLMDDEPASVESPVGALVGAALVEGVDGGIPATDVATAVVSAVDDGQFWILTHDDSRQPPIERMQRAASQTNPPLIGEN
ncbi:SDR family NAD(P)-dependent oxidoreductase [Ilumatobacter coccineus]|uniref:Putative oxidoreductase n=1 Tax=Ilumatobacter coccineus (strain NBRC 103263 / KCTC 29153 / YM16-304) TaxID=1313172 RepID=A0A6C7E8G1_ILUCY|nr:SDR family NAD(P)-dependent oxidoreductase [Ilumatobacter coccineus]BAN03944.1 putative oxidoreductase [Ilumatobacter coccineus YM16-304]